MPPQTLRDYVREQAARWRVPEDLAFAVIEQESGGTHQPAGGDVTTSSQRARGLFQLLPETARGEFNLNADDPLENVEAGIRYLRQGLDRNAGDVDRALAYYHGGPNLQQHGPNTQAYTRAVKEKFLARLQQTKAPAARAPLAAAVNPVGAPLAAARGNIGVPLVRAVEQGGPPPPPGVWDRIKAFGGELQSIDPRPAYRMAVDATQALIDDPKAAFGKVPEIAQAIAAGMMESSGQEYQKMVERYQRGDYFGAALQAKNYLLSGIGVGQRLRAAEEYMGQGDYTRGLGATADVALMGLPSRLAQAGQVRVTPRLRTRLPPEKAAAVEFGLRHDIPVDLGTATGGRWVRRFGSAMENTPLGAPVRLGAELQRGRRIPEVGRELAGRLYPQGVTAEAAGSGVRESLEDLITQRHQRANVNYDRLRRIEALPANTQSIQTGTRQVPILGANGQPLLDAFGNPLPPRIVPIIEQIQLPVDLRVPKQRLRPMYDRLRRQLAITQQQASPGLRALENLMDGPDFAPATQVDADLSVIKSLARGADLPELRDVSQGIAARGVEALSTAVDQAVARAGPRAVRALEQGRRATRLKYATAEVLDLLREEPVGAFQQLTQRGDTRINFLRDIAAQTPQDMPRVARAVLDELMDTGTQRGGYESAATIANRWERLGPETRNILFGQGHSQDLDQFFLLTRMLAEHPNPSMTAFGLYSTLSGMWLWANPATGVPANVLAGGIAALLNSRAGVRLLTRGLVIPGGTAAAAAWGAEAANLLGRAVEEEGGPPPPPSASASSPSEVTLTLRGESSR